MNNYNFDSVVNNTPTRTWKLIVYSNDKSLVKEKNILNYEDMIVR